MADTFESQFGRSIETSHEKKESKEAEVDPELQAAATLERADYLVKEVKNNKQQMQNIVLHMQQVQHAIKQIRKQLQLSATNDDSSVQQDKAQVQKLQKQIAEYQKEIVHMRDDLINAQTQELQKIYPDTPPHTLKEKAEQMVDTLITQIQE